MALIKKGNKQKSGKTKTDEKTPEQLWREVMAQQQSVIVRRIVTAVESCLIDLNTVPSETEREKIWRICSKLVGYDPISRGVRTSALDIWNRVYRCEYGPAPDDRDRR
ncbi:MAG TPA: hypothetical protein VN260_05695 [Dissulfurispiraceae bacterium]|nr:hypothetical protein [Dissulfurispiraceae bacterium]